MEMKDIPVKLIIAGAFCAAAMGSCSYGVWNSAQHDREIEADFRNKVHESPEPRLIEIETEGVTRQGYLNKGSSIDPQNPETAFIIATSDEGSCWYTTLRVTDGREHLPFLQKIGGGAEDVDMYANQSFRSGYKCVPTSDGKTISSPKTPGQ